MRSRGAQRTKSRTVNGEMQEFNRSRAAGAAGARGKKRYAVAVDMAFTGMPPTSSCGGLFSAMGL
jgi:hypothetical protein